MFKSSSTPRLYGVQPGADFPRKLVDGLKHRLQSQPPETMARVELFVNTRRMQRRLRTLFEAERASFLPKIRLITDLAHDPQFSDIPPPVSPLRRRLELSQLIAKLLEKEPSLAVRSAIFDLADSLADLLDEMQGEGVPPDILRGLDVADVSGHWQKTLDFVALVERFFAEDTPGTEARQRMVAERLVRLWMTEPPQHPIIVAGSTGSRGTTALFMEAVSQLPQGAIVLPGFDFDMPHQVWAQLDNALSAEDHPQFRFAKFADRLGINVDQVKPWCTVQDSSRTRLISLSLRPAPVTDQWLVEGAELSDLDGATADLTLIEADTPRAEATSIALILRKAVEDGITAALISPDRELTRQVTAGLDRWGIVPDDSAGRPLQLTAPGRFLRQVGALFGQNLTADKLVALLKHPLVSTGGGRGEHLLHTRELELWIRRVGAAFVEPHDLAKWAGDVAERISWVAWIEKWVGGLSDLATAPLSAFVNKLIEISEALCAGPEAVGSGELWQEPAGEEADRVMAELNDQAEHGGTLSASEFTALLGNVLSDGSVRDTITAHPDIMIWGTLEARVQGADLVILAGLNEGAWPSPPRPDAWLNRQLRNRAGLLLPEREIGLSAHDYQQAICAPRVILSRSIRDAEAQTIASRWLSRLTNLLEGLPSQGPMALAKMRQRGAYWTNLAAQLDSPEHFLPPAVRPAPRPPIDQRPKSISITEVQRLIRDPYEVYAKRVLGLKKLEPLVREPDAPLRGILFHSVVEKFVSEPPSGNSDTDCARLLAIADHTLANDVGWCAARLLWKSRISKMATWFVETEYKRRQQGAPLFLEAKGQLLLASIHQTLNGKIDRIDLLNDGTLAIYDYKTGRVPTKSEQVLFDKQLMLSALVAESTDLDGRDVSQVGYIGIGSKPTFDPKPLESGEFQKTLDELQSLLESYQNATKGYASRRAVDRTGREGDYDHLARFGEWNESDAPTPEDVG